MINYDRDYNDMPSSYDGDKRLQWVSTAIIAACIGGIVFIIANNFFIA